MKLGDKAVTYRRRHSRRRDAATNMAKEVSERHGISYAEISGGGAFISFIACRILKMARVPGRLCALFEYGDDFKV